MPPRNLIENDVDDSSSVEEINPGYELSITSSVNLGNESKESIHAGDGWITSIKDEQFPPFNMAWLKDFERNPDEPLKRSYRQGIPLEELDPNAPTITIGITFLEGRDKPSVARAEMNKVSYGEPDQQTPQWRIDTAATLLKRFEVGDDLSINRKDDSQNIVKIQKERKKMRRSPIYSDREKQTSPKVLSRAPPEEDSSQAVIKRNIQDNTLTIDSNQVKLIHGINSISQEFDIVCTMIEIDMFSMRDLMKNYHTIIQSGKRNMTTKDILQILDTMINDVRCLCTRSPRLFRMGTRSAIAQSTTTLYGVDYSTLFVTLTTSEGIRKLVESSSAYYLSLNETKLDQDAIRPKFLQMLVLLLSLLNNDDLGKIRKMLESTFQIPGDRANLELLIMKVLPLSSINPSVFLEDLLDTYQPLGHNRGGYEERLHRTIWRDLQLDLALKGYVVPVPTEDYGPSGLHSADDGIADDLEAMLDSTYLDSQRTQPFPREQSQPNHNDTAACQRMTWLASWPRDGVYMSTMFKYLQHDGRWREDGNSKQATIQAMNDIPHLEVTAEDGRENVVLALFTIDGNKVQYRVSAMDPEVISSMEKGQYVLKGVEDESVSSLEIEDEVLNGPFISATRHLNGLLKELKSCFGGRDLKRRSMTSVFSSNRPSLPSFALINEPTEATKVWADVVSSAGERHCCAVAFKIGNRVVYREDIIREMNSCLSKLNAAVARLEQELTKYSPKRLTDEQSRQQHGQVLKLTEILNKVKSFIEEARIKRVELQSLQRNHPEDPITRVVYPSFAQTIGEKPEWQSYQTQLAKDGERLVVKSKKLTVDTVSPAKDHVVKLTFVGSTLTLSVELMISGTPSDSSPKLSPRSTVLWIGYYLVVVEEGLKPPEQSVLGYCRVVSQKRGPDSRSKMSGVQHMKQVLSVLV